MNVFHALAVARATLPRLTLAQRVIDQIVRNALIYQTETGESLVGFAIKSLGRPEPDLYVIDTIAPDESAIRRGAYFEQGDDLQGDIFTWWFDNWNLFRARRRGSYGNAIGAKWDVPLAHLGDWHKHPGTLIEPSWGDSDTARNHIADETTKTPQLLAILATVWNKAISDAYDAGEPPDSDQPKPIKVPIDDQTVVRIDCWYMSRNIRRFVRLSPIVIEDKLLPALPTLSWDLKDPDRLSKEIADLSAEGYAVSVEQYDADKQPPLEICFWLAKRDSQRVLIIVTDADYPAKMPAIRIASMSALKDVPEGGDLFVPLWTQSEPLDKALYPDWPWTPDHSVVDLVRAVEAKLVEGSAVP